jgi:hypothetical protein
MTAILADTTPSEKGIYFRLKIPPGMSPRPGRYKIPYFE